MNEQARSITITCTTDILKCTYLKNCRKHSILLKACSSMFENFEHN